MLKIDAWSEIRKRRKTDTIAVVGNAPSALNFRIGPQIDNCDLVVRMNNYQLTEEFKPFIGSRTDVFATNFYKKDMKRSLQDLKDHKVDMIWSSIPFCRYVNHWEQDIVSGEKTFPGYDIYVCKNYDFFQMSSSSDAYNILRFGIFSIFRNFAVKMFGKWWPVPSTGLMSIFQAICLKPKRIIITGFNFFSTGQAHYFEKDSKPPSSTHHKFPKEPKIIMKLTTKNENIEFLFAVSRDIIGQEGRKNIQFLDSI